MTSLSLRAYGTKVGALLGDAMLLAVDVLEVHPRALAGGRIDRHHVAQVDRRIFLNAAALLVALIGAHVLPHAVDALDDDAVAVADNTQNLSGLALVGAGDDHDDVTGFNS